MAFYDKLKEINKLKTEKKPQVSENAEPGEEDEPIEVVKNPDFQFMNRVYSYTPENVVYYHAAIYYGDEIFSPQNNGSKDLREQKERALLDRLIQLSEWINPTYNLGQQRARVLQVLKDLAGDNIRITQGSSGKSVVPSVSLFGGMASISVEKWFSPGEGRFGAEFHQAVRSVNKMTPEQFNKLNSDSEKEVPLKPEGKLAPKTPSKSHERVEQKTKPTTIFDKSLPKPKTPIKVENAVDEEEEEEVNIRRSKPKTPPKPTTKVQEPEEELDEELSSTRPNIDDEIRSGVDEEDGHKQNDEETEEERELHHSM